MKRIVLGIITFYQLLFPIRGYCRYSPTCSQYAKIVIERHGVIKGSWLALLRLLTCQPFGNFKFQISNCFYD